MKPGWGNSSSQHRGGGHSKPRPVGEGLGWGLHTSEHAQPSGPAPPPWPSPTGREEGQQTKLNELQQVHYFHPCRARKFCRSFAPQMQQSRAGGAASGSGCRERARSLLAGGGVWHGRSVAGPRRVGKWFAYSPAHSIKPVIGKVRARLVDIGTPQLIGFAKK